VKPKHTPGPWKPGKDGLVNGDGIRVADCGWDVEGEEREANAQLIAAAPDLLEALKTAVAFIAVWSGVYQSSHGLADVHPEHAKALAEAQAAIKKAEGQ
jgi:hypothetical protein